MPLVTCPGCNRHIDLLPENLKLPTIICARCETAFDPVYQLAPVYPLDVATSIRAGLVGAYQEMERRALPHAHRINRMMLLPFKVMGVLLAIWAAGWVIYFLLYALGFR